MPTFDYSFTVDAPLDAVSEFHSSTDILKKLTPPPVFVQVKQFGAMQEGMLAEFTMWFGPIPSRWRVVHVDVDQHGFTDVQLEGPLAEWRHTHRFEAIDENRTRVHEHIEYSYPDGWQGLIARLAFNRLALYGLFSYRRLITRWAAKR